MHGLLFDLGGTFLRAAVAGEPLRSVWRTRIPSIATGAPEPAIWRYISDGIAQYAAAHRASVPPEAPVVLSFPGPIANGSRVVQAPTVAGGSLTGFDLPRAVAELTGRRVLVLNDVSAAAWRISETSNVGRFLVVTVSSGIGSKLFDRCHPAGVLDSPPYAGEIGHVVVDDRPDAPVCDCGGRGHLGAIASGRAIERLAREQARTNTPAFLASCCARSFGATAETINNEEHIVPALLAGDPWITGIAEACTRPLVRSLLTVAMAAGLERVFIIGGFAVALGPCYLELLRTLTRELCRYQVACVEMDRLFVIAPTTEETCLEGCAAYLRRGALR